MFFGSLFTGIKGEKKLISVIVAAYNIESYLPRCLDSILGQTYRDLEIIVVDDGSTDNRGLRGGKSSDCGLCIQEGKGRGAAKSPQMRHKRRM